MPQAIAAAVAYIWPALGATSIGYIGVGAISYATLIGYAVTIGASIAYSSSQNAKMRNALRGLQDTGRSVMSRDPLAQQRGIYGEIPVAGPIAFLHTTGAKNEYLHLVELIAGHECNALGTIYFENADGLEEVPLDGSGNATGKYAGFFSVTKYLGTTTQNADATLIAAAPTLWTSAHRLRGNAYLRCRFTFSADLFPNGLPTVRCMVQGRKLLDPRVGIYVKTCDMAAGNTHIGCSTTSLSVGMRVIGPGIVAGTRIVSIDGSGTFFTVDVAPQFTDSAISLACGVDSFSKNAALCTADYMADFKFGRKIGWHRIDTTGLSAEANICDEDVVKADASTEKRYTCNGAFLSDSDAMPDLVSSFGGKVCDTGGFWTILTGAYRSPAAGADFTDSDLCGAFQLQGRQSMRESFSGVRGTYFSPENNWQPGDFPAVKNATYAAKDRVRRWKDVAYSFVTSPATAQRLAKIELELGRQQVVFQAVYKLKAFKVAIGDTIRITRAEEGWTNKLFEVIDWSLRILTEGGNNLTIAVAVTCKETASACYDWANGEETVVDLAPNTDLPDPSIVPSMASFAVVSDAFVQDDADGTVVPRLRASWTAVANIYIEQGGFAELEYKAHASSTWLPLPSLGGAAVSMYIGNVLIGESYDVRGRFINQLGVRGAWTTVTSVVATGDVTAPGAPTGLTAINGGAKLVSLDWDDNLEADLNEYGIHRNTANSFVGSTKIAEVSASRFVDVDVTAGVTYYYWVTAIDRSDNVSSPSSVASATPTSAGGGIDTTPPSDPSAPTFSASSVYFSSDGTTRAKITINVPSMPTLAVILNVLYRRNGSSGWQVADQRSAGGSTSTIDDLTPLSQYDIAVQAFSAYGYASNIVAATGSPFTAPSDTTAPSAPTGLAAVAGTGKSVSLDWDDNTNSDLSEYGVYRNTANSFGGATKIAETRASRFVDVEVTIGTTYYYWVTAYDRTENQSGQSSVAGPVSPGTIPASATDATAPGTPSAASKTGQGNYNAGDGGSFAYLDISVPGLPSLAKYQNLLYKKTGGGGDWLIAAQLENSSTQTVRIDDLIPGIAYDVAVIAFTAFAIASAITTATSSPFTAPNKSASPNAPTSASLTAPSSGDAPPLFQGAALMYATRLQWTHPTDTDAAYIEVKATNTNSDPATDYSWTGGGANAIVRIPVGAAPVCYLYNSLGTTSGFVRLRTVDRTGNASAWVSVGNCNSATSLPAGTMTNQNSNAVVVTGFKVGSSTTQQLIQQIGRTVITLTGGSPTESYDLNISGLGFTTAPDTGFLMAYDWGKVDVRYDWDDSTSTVAKLRIAMNDGSNLPTSLIIGGWFVDTF